MTLALEHQGAVEASAPLKRRGALGKLMANKAALFGLFIVLDLSVLCGVCLLDHAL